MCDVIRGGGDRLRGEGRDVVSGEGKWGGGERPAGGVLCLEVGFGRGDPCWKDRQRSLLSIEEAGGIGFYRERLSSSEFRL